MDSSLSGGEETAADRRHCWTHDAVSEFYVYGPNFRPLINYSQEAWDFMAGWPLRSPDENVTFINVNSTLRGMLTADINLIAFGRAQMANPSSLLNALPRMPGVFYFADGNTMG